MPERKKYSLSQLTELLKDTIENIFEKPVWVVAEIKNITFREHVYLELVEKQEGTNRIIAKMRGNIWRSYRKNVIDKFELLTNEPFREGLKVLLYAYVSFHPFYGLSLDIRDIDPYFTIGDIFRRRQEIIDQLKQDGIFEMNRSLSLPIVIQRIAVISSDTAAGYEDFVHQLNSNQYGIVFYNKLYKAFMQGEQAEQSIINALDEIFSEHEYFDAVVIIRGGGSKADLSVYDSYNLATNIAQFPLPVITGIGHTRDKSVVDLVANTSLKTPTAVASFLIDKAAHFRERLNLLYDKLIHSSEKFILYKKSYLHQLYSNLQQASKDFLWHQKSKLHSIDQKLKSFIYIPDKHRQKLRFLYHRLTDAQERFLKNNRLHLLDLEQRLKKSVYRVFKKQKDKLKFIKLKIEKHDPQRILDAGYSITLHKGKVLKSTEQVNKGDKIITVLANGRLISQIKKKNKD